jgi:hypothetical protein
LKYGGIDAPFSYKVKSKVGKSFNMKHFFLFDLSEQCYQWLNDYLGSHPTESDYQNLLEAIAALVYSDDEIANEEAKLLSELQSLAPTHESSQLTFDKLLKAIGRLYQQKFR